VESKTEIKDTTVLQEPMVGTYDIYCILNVSSCTQTCTESYKNNTQINNLVANMPMDFQYCSCYT